MTIPSAIEKLDLYPFERLDLMVGMAFALEHGELATRMLSERCKGDKSLQEGIRVICDGLRAGAAEHFEYLEGQR